MRSYEALYLGAAAEIGQIERPTLMVGITHPQTGLVLRGRLRALQDAGFRVILVSSPGPLLDSFAASEGVEKLAIPMQRSRSLLLDAVSLVRLCRAMYRTRPDITEFSTPKAGLLGSLASWFCHVPVRVYILRGLRLETSKGITRRILAVAERFAIACCHVTVCNSKSLQTKTRRLLSAPRSKLLLLGKGSSNGVDVNRFAPGPSDLRAALGIALDTPVVGFVGRLTRDKGIPELMQAFDELLTSIPDAILLLVGWYDDSEDALSPSQCAAIGCHPRVVQTGFVRDTAPYYRIMDILVLPTWREGFPNVVLEAAATGIPVITTTATGARDAVVPGVTGLLVPLGDAKALQAAMLQLLRDPACRQQMGRAAREWVTENFLNTRVHGLTVNLYRSLLGRPRTVQAKDAPAVAD